MATGNMSKHEIVVTSPDPDSYLISASCRIIQDLTDIYINPEESISVDAEAAHLQSNLNSETPNKYPNAPHSSPITSQNDADTSVFNEELVKCLNELPVILLSLEERIKDGSIEVLEVDSENSSVRNNCEASISTESGDLESFQYENISKNCSMNSLAVTASNDHSRIVKSESTQSFSKSISMPLEKLNFLRVDSIADFNRDFYRRSSLSDNTSLIVNCASDASDISLEDVESVSSDDSSSRASRDRIEFEALALDSAIHPSTLQGLQNWRTRVRNKRALSLDEINPSKILNNTDFSKTPFGMFI